MKQPDENESSERSNRINFGRWDVVAVVVLILVVVGVLLPPFVRLRGGGSNNLTHCMNNLRQIGLATASAASVNNKLPPAFGTVLGKPPAVKLAAGELAHEATLFYFLLPHLEQVGTFSRLPPLFNYPEANQYVVAPGKPLGGTPDENAASFHLRVYQCPSDESSDPSGVTQLSLTPGKMAPSPWGLNSYAANYLLFGMVKDARLPESVPDGPSVTIFFAEKAGACDDTVTGRRGGNLWAAPPFFPSDPNASVNFGGTFGYDPAQSNPTRPFAMSLFQSMPPAGGCDPTLAQSPHKGIINVSMGDGSARSISSTISPKTWSALLTPYPVSDPKFPGGSQARSDVPGFDWN